MASHHQVSVTSNTRKTGHINQIEIEALNRLTAESISGHTHTKRGIFFEFLNNKENAYKTLP